MRLGGREQPPLRLALRHAQRCRRAPRWHAAGVRRAHAARAGWLHRPRARRDELLLAPAAGGGLHHGVVRRATHPLGGLQAQRTTGAAGLRWCGPERANSAASAPWQVQQKTCCVWHTTHGCARAGHHAGLPRPGGVGHCVPPFGARHDVRCARHAQRRPAAWRGCHGVGRPWPPAPMRAAVASPCAALPTPRAVSGDTSIKFWCRSRPGDLFRERWDDQGALPGEHVGGSATPWAPPSSSAPGAASATHPPGLAAGSAAAAAAGSLSRIPGLGDILSKLGTPAAAASAPGRKCWSRQPHWRPAASVSTCAD